MDPVIDTPQPISARVARAGDRFLNPGIKKQTRPAAACGNSAPPTTVGRVGRRHVDFMMMFLAWIGKSSESGLELPHPLLAKQRWGRPAGLIHTTLPAHIEYKTGKLSSPPVPFSELAAPRRCLGRRPRLETHVHGLVSMHNTSIRMLGRTGREAS